MNDISNLRVNPLLHIMASCKHTDLAYGFSNLHRQKYELYYRLIFDEPLIDTYCWHIPVLFVTTTSKTRWPAENTQHTKIKQILPLKTVKKHQRILLLLCPNKRSTLCELFSFFSQLQQWIQKMLFKLPMALLALKSQQTICEPSGTDYPLTSPLTTPWLINCQGPRISLETRRTIRKQPLSLESLWGPMEMIKWQPSMTVPTGCTGKSRSGWGILKGSDIDVKWEIILKWISKKLRGFRVCRSVHLDKLIKQRNIINHIKAQRLSWFGHVKRMPDTRTVKKIFNWKPLTKRSQGRPK